MSFISNFIDKLTKMGAYLSAFILVSLVSLILIEIFIRSLFDMSTMIADEYSGYFYLASIFFGLAYTFSSDSHIRINIITSRLSKKVNRKIDILAALITLAVLAFALYRTALFTYDSYSLEMLSENVSETPLYLTQLAMPIGITMFMLAVVLFIFKGFTND
ncbi:TRAP transporter small permease subunit [Halarcobacter bivalviorum]|uniref:C4-dicarboxylate ABC transporter permease n=1 Tax=Halarcobacter bivalviorum TaxID=663364 RepID=A0AAX2ABW3_9BACT|nr:TRAP transporter small permease [Halarcobacter bivalviorum]AXH11792.1 TRAP transporter, small permease subunit [Halarcobacter bivalviorum]RXK10919.1 C4-dicarboxylate ABC transporter permease [Halarcobacter bivalviorum]